MSHMRYDLRRPRLQRSVLAVPGSNPRMIERAAASDADSVFLDLEDAVAPGDKVKAKAWIDADASVGTIPGAPATQAAR